MNSVQSFADRVLDAAGAVDMLIMCAAIAGKPYKLSPQGYEIHYATNFLGHFALTHHLLPSLLEQRARVVVVSSVLHTYADDAGPDFNYSSLPLWGSVGGWWAYCRSNLAKTWFGYELQRRHPELTVPVCHPGVIDSGLTVVPTNLLQSVKASLLISPVDGARTPLYCALSPDAKGNTFYHNVLGIISSSSASYDVTRAVPHYDAALKMMNSHKGAVSRESRTPATTAAPVGPAAPTTNNGSGNREKVRLDGTGMRK
jgi:NAD(P)-dependent dehydrogenase (short-subunit alcohol dehydrogenase family)